MNENTKIREKKRNLETAKWISIAILFSIAVLVSYLYRNVQIPLYKFIVISLMIAAVYISLLTKKGKEIILFFREARTEARKIIWPSRQETLHTSLIIVAVTTIVSFILWGLDGILIRLISLITNLRF